jgi:hypothetical protein
VNAGKWYRTGSSGEQSVWEYRRGPRFRIEVAGAGRLSRYVWHVEDDTDIAFGHFATAEGIRGFIRCRWKRHLRGLTGHERAEYLLLGLASEEELCEAAETGSAGP